jgi:pimeloyl-ACP methyl ester carboxylesterase/DNA-binding CsgD family transcriptional regulator
VRVAMDALPARRARGHPSRGRVPRAHRNRRGSGARLLPAGPAGCAARLPSASVTELGAAIRFVRFDGSRVAFAVSGEGPPLVAAAWWVSHLELDWRDVAFRSFWGSTAAGRALVRYDHPGTGMSDREVDPTALTLDDEVALLGAVMDELGLGRVSLVGGSSGGCAAIAFAARFPERVDRLLLYGTYADGASIAPPDVREALVAAVRAHWGLGSRVLADVFVGAEDGEARRRFVRDQRASARAETAAALLELAYRMDVRPLLEQVRAPTVVVHRRADRAIPYACGHDLAGSIRGARLVSVDGDAHLPWVGDWMSVSRALGSFLTGTPAADPAAPAVLLSRREREVLTLIAGGLSDREIAERIAVSHHTVHRHVANIRHKLGSGSRAAAVAEAVRLGLL